jgi:hypothetical protein
MANNNKSSEIKFLNEQLVSAALRIRDIALSAPLWAAIFAVVLGGPLPELGQVPLGLTWPWILICGVAACWAYWASRLVQRKGVRYELKKRTHLRLVAVIYFLVGAVWALILPVYWAPGNELNHVFLAPVIIGAVSLVVGGGATRDSSLRALLLRRVCASYWDI